MMLSWKNQSGDWKVWRRTWPMYYRYFETDQGWRAGQDLFVFLGWMGMCWLCASPWGQDVVWFERRTRVVCLGNSGALKTKRGTRTQESRGACAISLSVNRVN